MITNYGMFNLHESNNELLLLFDDSEITSEKQNNVVTCIYHEDKLIGYRIPNFIQYAKIKYSGIIFLPNKILIDVINNILLNDGLEKLAYKEESGYITKEVNGQKVVYCKPGTFLRDETISNGHVCTFRDLYIDNDNPDEILLLEEDVLLNRDFFKTEAK